MKHPEIFFRTLSVPIVFVLLAVGFHEFMRGHNAPGGGFIAGLIIAVAALLTRMATEHGLLTVRPRLLVPIGLFVALAGGIGPMLIGHPFLKSWHGYVEFPLFGPVELSSALAFDLGVFLVVVGATITIIDLLGDDTELARLGLDQEPSPVIHESTVEEITSPKEEY